MPGDEHTPVMGDKELEVACRLSLRKLQPPMHVPGFDEEQFLGRGAFGEVWVAKDTNTGQRVAIKYYSHRGSVDWNLLSREVDKLRSLDTNRQVVKLLKVGWDADPPFYVMEFMEKGSLEDRLRQRPMSVDEALPIFRGVCRGLLHAHSKGIVHCDLKPANILLDEDDQPRLADFGQSRLTHEHAPALGTLFYMAPEQADLKASPDVRWDVYALGAILYRMLTGEPPHRRTHGSEELQKTSRREEKLRRYRELIRKSKAAGHRKMVDRALADIIDRCLSYEPKRRFASVQELLTALDQRALARARRPLLVFGAVGPILLAMVMAWGGYDMLQSAVRNCSDLVVEGASQSNLFTAKQVARNIALEVDRRWKVLEQEASEDTLFRKKLLAAFSTWQQRNPHLGDRERTDWWLEQEQRKELQEFLDELHMKYASAVTATNWLVLDADGWMLARSNTKPEHEKMLLGRDFCFREYFHGLDEKDLDREKASHNRPPPITRSHRSIVFLSAATTEKRVIFSVPIFAPPGSTLDTVNQSSAGVMGVLAISVQAEKLRSNHPALCDDNGDLQQFASVVDTKLNWEGKPGLIVEHPEVKPREFPYWDNQGVAWLRSLSGASGLRDATRVHHVDPVLQGTHTWIAGAAPVLVKRANEEPRDTHWVVVVQQRNDIVSTPVAELESSLRGKLFVALGLIVAVTAGLWVFVLGILNPTSRSWLARKIRGFAGLPTSSQTNTASSVGSSRSGTGSLLSGSEPKLLRTGSLPPEDANLDGAP
jgi:hypothetical protein